MKRIYSEIIDPKVKISLDMHSSILKLIDSAAKMTGSNRTIMIGALIGKGVSPLISEMEITWKGLITAGNLSEEKIKKIKNLLSELEKLKKQWAVILSLSN